MLKCVFFVLVCFISVMYRGWMNWWFVVCIVFLCGMFFVWLLKIRFFIVCVIVVVLVEWVFLIVCVSILIIVCMCVCR